MFPLFQSKYISINVQSNWNPRFTWKFQGSQNYTVTKGFFIKAKDIRDPCF